MELLNHDLKLINNALEMSKHIGQIFDFSLSGEPLNEWWWHLDKVASGEVVFKLSAEME